MVQAKCVLLVAEEEYEQAQTLSGYKKVVLDPEALKPPEGTQGEDAQAWTVIIKAREAREATAQQEDLQLLEDLNKLRDVISAKKKIENEKVQMEGINEGGDKGQGEENKGEEGARAGEEEG